MDCDKKKIDHTRSVEVTPAIVPTQWPLLRYTENFSNHLSNINILETILKYYEREFKQKI